ncbi:hypothetical protein HF086_013796 [Spodoptera exigua]|uniref:RNA cytosine-C(5)-methyltransferase NSUN2-like PUA domain-containing protein n=1 Tax=Spodoptera exigua TaxID=7107 RepID=A0A922MAT4_SPOEX|nr:hypothetical protein HF086_013796 [Spodoptera exigua]
MILLNFTQIRLLTLGNYLKRMGRKNRQFNKFAQRKRERKEQEKNPQEKPAADTRKHYEDIVRENAAFEEYYKNQKVCPDEEWDTFMKTLKENLPTAFRITGSKCEAAALMKIVQSQYFSEILNMKLQVEGDGEQGEEIKPINLPWYPGGYAWQLRLSRTDIRRNEALYKLHNFLVAETAAGGVSRQETVSMIPPVVLDVQPHHKYRVLKRGCELLEVGGMTYWRPASKDMVFYEKYEDVPEKWQTVVRPQMFPPKPEDLPKYNLDRWLSQEGLQSITQFIGPKRRLRILKEDLILVLQNDNPSKPPDVKLFTPQTQELVKDFATGSCVLEYKEEGEGTNLELTLVGWRGKASDVPDADAEANDVTEATEATESTSAAADSSETNGAGADVEMVEQSAS